MKQHWLVRTRTIQGLWAFGVVGLVLTVLGEFLVDRHPHFGFDQLPGFNAIFGFLACVALIVVAKLIGFALKRADTFYGDEPDD